MNTRPESLIVRMTKLLAIVLLATLAVACGPGTGGTGTGPVNGIASFGGTVGTTFGTGLSVGLPCTDDCPAVSLRLENERAEFSAPCRRFVHEGAWSVDASGLATLDGTLETETVTNGQHTKSNTAAVLRLQFSEAVVDSKQVMVNVRDAQGRNVLPALNLQRDSAGAATIGTCGG